MINTSSSTTSLGALSKLSSELKFIEGMQPVKITSVQNAQTANGTSQIIGVQRNDRQQLTLINPKPDASIRAGDQATLNVSNKQVASLTLQGTTAATSNVNQANSSSSTTAASQSSSNTYTPAASQYRQPSSSATSASSITNTTQTAKVIADVAVASRPITLTVISSNAPQPATVANSNNQASNTSVQSQANQANNSVATNTSQTQNTTRPMTPVDGQPTPRTPIAPPANLSTGAAQPATTANHASGASATYTAVVSDGKQQFTLTTQHPLKAGETLQVVIDKSNQLQLLPSQRTSPTEATLTDSLKQSLPKQITAQEMSSMIRQLTALTQSGQALPEKVNTALEQLVRQLPNLQTVTQSGESIKQAIQNSGLFSEHNLAQKVNLNTDLKLNLSRLESAVSTSAQQGSTNVTSNASTNSAQPALNMVSGAIERITTGQVRHLIESAQQDGSILPLSVEIPIKDGRSSSVVNLHIDKDQTQDQQVEAHNRRWLVQLKFDFEETGRFEARTSIQGQKVGIIFAVEQAPTERMIREKLDDLRSNLRSKKVEIETLDCFQAKLKDNKETTADSSDKSNKRLIDVRT